MKKVIINENWEEVLVEDDSYFYAIIYSHNIDKAKYVKSYDTNYEIVYPEFKTFTSQRALLKYSGGVYGEGFIILSIEGGTARLIDPNNPSSVWYRKRTF